MCSPWRAAFANRAAEALTRPWLVIEGPTPAGLAVCLLPARLGASVGPLRTWDGCAALLLTKMALWACLARRIT